MKIVNNYEILIFFKNIWVKWLEPKFLTRWSRTKMDRLRNTDRIDVKPTSLQSGAPTNRLQSKSVPSLNY
jgi:hypothetical protein